MAVVPEERMTQVVDRMGGTVTRISTNGGYVMITGDDQQSYFAHVTFFDDGARMDELVVGDRCSFVPMNSPKGLRASLVRFVRPV